MTLMIGSPKVQFFKTNRVEYLTGGKLYSYISGTTTPKLTYPTIADALAGTNANTNPVILDARGEADVVVKGATTLVLKDELDNVIWSVDDVDLSESDIFDSNGNAVLKFVGKDLATNEITISNAPSGENPMITSSGGEDDVGLEITSKGAANLYLDAGITGNVEIGSKSGGGVHIRKATVAYGNVEIQGVTTFKEAVTTDNTKAFSLIPAGVVMWKASVVVPAGWLECNGAAVSRTTYAALFADIGTTYGNGDGSTTFNLPNQARRTIVGRGGVSTGVLANSVSSLGGFETHTLTSGEMPNHSHDMSSLSSFISVLPATGSSPVPLYGLASTSATGGGQAHNNMQPSIVMMMIIRAY